MEIPFGSLVVQDIGRAGDPLIIRLDAEHPKQPGERATKYKADFVYRNSTGLVVEDVKGFLTPEYRIKRKLLLWVHGVRISEVR